ncbi:Polysaccharide pyruvyl transferase [Pseudobutyrivibrio sp. YE44]|uniref:polysaccharide pyruvyl transferase family protein n=1 Tax=Pseudobutyrivibrio sp. YE44 TaxID=1520802 RepID=UPI00088ADBD6|nr:polysaccharide pyruvyl transferase family protein [Pseudobutyrivibrio sp. YE44]SDB46936.1 Polysaccharide pyruvyl transferase [Pseudobutyrivibrio sp. YE44]
MKIGILTFHRAVNYGAVLQAYALNKSIRDMGHDCDIVDYKCEKIESVVSPFAGFTNGDNWIKSFIQLIFRVRKNKAFNSFIKKYISLSSKEYTPKDIKQADDVYDCFFSGSDQVWNYACTDGDEAYFLDFVKDSKKKNSYAASFGFEKRPDYDKFDYEELLNDFNGISVREESGKNLVKSFSGKDSEVVVDPTLLLSKEEWEKVVGKRPIAEDYIFVYYIREPKDLLDYANKLSEATGCKVINAKKSVEFFKNCSPADFLAWIYYSKYFVTNSFHGTVFSILFKKKFAIELDNGKSVNNRSKELLELVGITGRDLDMNNIMSVDNEIDYTVADKTLNEQKKEALDFIKDCINKAM